MLPSNPFFHRGPIHDRVYFFGRERELAQALSLLGNGQSICVIGQRRIGKSSLLFHLADPDIFSQYQLNPAEHLFVYLDGGGLSGLDQAGFYRLFLEEICDALALKADLPDVCSDILAQPQSLTYRAFEQTLRLLTRQGWKPILLLDEFERLSSNPALTPDFFSGLRALTAKYPIAYVTASKQPLLELTYADAGALSSPFFNIFATIRLGLFSEAEARDLLATLAAHAGLTFSPALLDFLLDLAGPHPLFLQIAGFHAFELVQTLAQTSQVSETWEVSFDYAELRRRFLASVEEHFGYYWRNLSPTEQRILATLPAATGNLSALERACLIMRRDNGYDYLSSTLAEFVQAQPIPGLLQIGALALDQSQHQVLLTGQALNLTPSQYTLLAYLMAHAGQLITNEALEQAVWGQEYIEDPERLKSVIKGLRHALGPEAARLENVRGVGYRFAGGIVLRKSFRGD